MNEDNLNTERAGANTYELAQRANKNSTSWNEVKVAQKKVFESSNTVHKKNSRFSLFVNGDYKTPDEFDSVVNINKPLYEMTVQPGDTYVVQGKERNPYLPGTDYVSGFASQFNDSGPDGQYVADGVKIILGLGNYLSGTLTNSAQENGGTKQGTALVIEPNEVTVGLYRDGNLKNQKRLTEGEWIFDPFTADDYDYNIEKFAVKRVEGNLYGSGSQNLHFKLRDVDTGEEKYMKVAETGDDEEPALNEFNLFNSVLVDVDASASSFTFSIGPLQYYNNTNSSLPFRRKRSTKRNLNVNATFGDTTGTVMTVYRKDPDNLEVPVAFRVGAKAQTNGRVELREVHPNYLDFGTIDETNDANWGAPEKLRQRETAMQELTAMTPGDVTISDDGEVRGEQTVAVEYDGQSNVGGRSVPSKSQQSERINEHNYLVAIAKHQSITEDILRYDLFTKEIW